jgi:hypothetical protein
MIELRNNFKGETNDKETYNQRAPKDL